MLEFDSFDYFENLIALSVLAVPLYFLIRQATVRCLLLGVIGVYLLYLVAPRLLLFYLGFWLFQFLFQHAISLWPSESSRWVILTGTIVLTLAPMVVWKVAPTWFIINFNDWSNGIISHGSSWFGAVDRVRNIILPIGLSFATFRAIDILVKVFLELITPLSPSRLFAVGFFPPVQVIGPVIEVTEIESDLQIPKPASPRDTISAVLMIAIGCAKVYFLAYLLEPSVVVFNPDAVGSPAAYWFELFRYAFYLYFNFSGFSDIAVGLALIYGFRIEGNFNNPYMKANPQDFWNSWHMSLTKFCQRNVFIPLGGFRANRQYIAIFATIMVIAMWHDISWPLVLFGLYHAAGLILYRYGATRRPASANPAWRLIKVPAMFVYFSLSLPLFLLSMDQIGPFYAQLFGVA